MFFLFVYNCRWKLKACICHNQKINCFHRHGRMESVRGRTTKRNPPTTKERRRKGLRVQNREKDESEWEKETKKNPPLFFYLSILAMQFFWLPRYFLLFSLRCHIRKSESELWIFFCHLWGKKKCFVLVQWKKSSIILRWGKRSCWCSVVDASSLAYICLQTHLSLLSCLQKFNEFRCHWNFFF